MPNTTFITWNDFKNHSSITLPRYITVRADGYLSIAMAVNVTSGVSHFYVPSNEEQIQVTGLGADLWFIGAIKVASIS